MASHLYPRGAVAKRCGNSFRTNLSQLSGMGVREGEPIGGSKRMHSAYKERNGECSLGRKNSR